jgi:hypothetical protein
MAEMPDLGAIADLRRLIHDCGWVRPEGHCLAQPLFGGSPFG